MNHDTMTDFPFMAKGSHTAHFLAIEMIMM
jgi:hypothetical protein